MRRLKEDVRTALPKLRSDRYKTLYVDPPWQWLAGGGNSYTPKQGANTHREFTNPGKTPYVRMKTSDLLALAPQVRRIMSADSHLYIWAINKTLPETVELVEAYGYRWVTLITWDKGRPGIAKYFQGMTEHCAFGVRGSVPFKFTNGKMAQGRTLITEKRTTHSRKPMAMREMIERVSYPPYLELFARKNASKKWDAVGLELEEL